MWPEGCGLADTGAGDTGNFFPPSFMLLLIGIINLPILSSTHLGQSKCLYV